MAYNEITKFQLLAAIIREDRAYRELEGAEAFGDVLIEILRRMHHWNDSKFDAPDVIDALFEAIAEEFRYAIGEWDKSGTDVDTSAEAPTNRDVLDAIEDTIKIARGVGAEVPNEHHFEGPMIVGDNNDMPPELDIPDQP